MSQPERNRIEGGVTSYGGYDGYGQESLRAKILALLEKHPGISAKDVCLSLHLHYPKHGQWIRNLKSQLRNQKRNHVDGRVQVLPKVVNNLGLVSGGVHRVEFGLLGGGLPGWLVGCVEGGVCGWVASGNRNGMLVWSGGGVRLRLFPSGTLLINSSSGRVLSLGEVQEVLWEAFLGFLPEERWEEWAALVRHVQIVDLHRVFDVGARVPPFKIRAYRESLGLTIFSDDSHNHAIEVEERIPPWFPIFYEAVEKLGVEMLKHLELTGSVADAGRAVRELAEALKEKVKKEG